MAAIRIHGKKWQVRISRKGHKSIIKSFIIKQDAERWARQVEVELDKGIYLNQNLAERTTFKELIERYMGEVTPTMRGAKPDLISCVELSSY